MLLSRMATIYHNTYTFLVLEKYGNTETHALFSMLIIDQKILLTKGLYLQHLCNHLYPAMYIAFTV